MKKGSDYPGVVVVTLCHDGNGKYVLQLRTERCRDEHHVWDSGGGALEFGETIEDALKREVFEEYGAKPKNIEFLGFRDVFRERDGEKSHWVAFDYKVEVDPQEVKIGEPEMCAKIDWFELEHFPEALHSQFPAFLEKYKDKL